MNRQSAIVFLADHLKVTVTPPPMLIPDGSGKIRTVADTLEVNQMTRIGIESEIDYSGSIVCRSPLLPMARLPKDERVAYCILRQLLGYNGQHRSQFHFGISNGYITVMHVIKCDQPAEGILDDYHRFRADVGRLLVDLASFIDHLLTTCADAAEAE